MTRTAMGTTDQKPQGTGSVMLGLAGGIGSSNWSKRVNKRKSYSSMLKKECGEGNKASCINPTKPPVEAAHNHSDEVEDVVVAVDDTNVDAGGGDVFVLVV